MFQVTLGHTPKKPMGITDDGLCYKILMSDNTPDKFWALIEKVILTGATQVKGNQNLNILGL